MDTPDTLPPLPLHDAVRDELNQLQAGVDAVLGLALGAVLVALAAWCYGRFVQSATSRHRGLAASCAVLALVVGAWLAWPPAQAGGGASATSGVAGRPGAAAEGAGAAASAWLPWSEVEVARAREAGRPVFVDFTAAWCVSCQANKKLVLERDAVDAEMTRRGVLRLRADWTQQDPAITAALARHGRNGVPLYLLYLPGEAQPRILPEILTPRAVLDALAALH